MEPLPHQAFRPLAIDGLLVSGAELIEISTSALQAAMFWSISRSNTSGTGMRKNGMFIAAMRTHQSLRAERSQLD
jgi:hypothetical protein